MNYFINKIGSLGKGVLIGVEINVVLVIWLQNLRIVCMNIGSGFFVFNVRVLVLSLPAKWMGVLWSIFECWRQEHEIPD